VFPCIVPSQPRANVLSIAAMHSPYFLSKIVFFLLLIETLQIINTCQLFLSDGVDASSGNPRMSSRITSVTGLPVSSQNFSSFSTSYDAKFIVRRLVAHFLFIVNHSFCICLYHIKKLDIWRSINKIESGVTTP